MKRKSDLFSIIIVLAFLAVLVIGALLSGGLFKEMGTQLKQTLNDGNLEGDALTNSLAAADVLETDAPNYLDNFMFWFLIAICLGMLISGLFLDFEPAVVIILMIVGLLAVGLSTFVSNFYDELANDAAISGAASSMGMSAAVFGVYFPIIIFIIFILTMIIMYSRKGGADGRF
jgi:hypothetical protein